MSSQQSGMSSQQSGPGADDEVVAEPFDQTNGLVDGLEGESGGTADGEARSAADRRGDHGEIDGTDDVAGQGAMDAGFIVGRQE